MGGVTTYGYDSMDQLISYTNAADSVTYAYNSAGERVFMQDVTGKSRTEYDALGRIIKERNGSGKEVTYTYDDAGNIAETGYPDGTKISYEYDDNWEVTRCTEKEEGGSKTVHNYTYDKAGNRTEYERIADGVSKVKYKYKYNDSGQLIL